MLNIDSYSRGVAQSGSVFALEARGRRFKSCHPDQMKEALRKLMDRFDPLNVLEWGYDAHETLEELLDGKERDREPSPLEIAAAQDVAEKPEIK